MVGEYCKRSLYIVPLLVIIFIGIIHNYHNGGIDIADVHNAIHPKRHLMSGYDYKQTEIEIGKEDLFQQSLPFTLPVNRTASALIDYLRNDHMHSRSHECKYI